MWITLEDESTMAVLDSRTGKVSQSARFGGQAATGSASARHLWVGDYGASSEDGSRRDRRRRPDDRREAPAHRTIEPYQLAADAESVWITDAIDKVQRVDVRSGKAGKPIRVDRPFDVVTRERTSVGGRERRRSAGAVRRPDGAAIRRPIDVGARPVAAAVGQGAIWVVTEPGRLVRASPDSGRTTAVAIGPPDPRRQIAADDRGVWVTEGAASVILADPAEAAAPDPRAGRQGAL